MIFSQSGSQQSPSETRDQILELIDNCVIASDDSATVLQSVLSPQDIAMLEQEHGENHLSSMDGLSIGDLFDGAVEFD